ncbi:hypothetical protein [Nocardia asiatica]|uniref:hypothetical protein n=1 Tax=Nocardia asiatica TaxID=209252 RepID=UPI003EE2DB8F
MDEEERERYSKYVGRQWFRGLPARQPGDYRRARDTRARSRDFGNMFRDSMVEMLGRTEDKGWRTEAHFKTPIGARFHDSAHMEDQIATEFKAGKVGKKALDQLRKDVFALEQDWVVEWYTVQGAKIDPRVAAQMRALADRFPGLFKHVQVTREQFAKAIELGKQRERERAERERARQQPAREAEARTHPQPPTKADTQRIEQERIEQERAEARADERAMQAMLDSHTRHQHAQQAEQQRTPDTRAEVGQTRDTASERDPADAARTGRKAAEQERAERIARAVREGLPPEVARLLTEGQAQPLSTALQSPSHDTPQVTRGGTLGQDRTRGQSHEQ